MWYVLYLRRLVMLIGEHRLWRWRQGRDWLNGRVHWRAGLILVQLNFQQLDLVLRKKKGGRQKS